MLKFLLPIVTIIAVATQAIGYPGPSSKPSPSSGSRSSSSRPSPPRPSYSRPAPSKPPTYHKPAAPSYKAPSAGRIPSYKAPTYKPSYKAPSYKPPTTYKAPTKTPVPTAKTQSGKTYSLGPKTGTATNSYKPASTKILNPLSQSAQHQESKARYQAATAPRPTYKTATGQTKTIKSDTPHVQTVRKHITHERYVTYDNRASSFYGSYYRTPYVYNDHFSPFLMGWLLSDTLNSHDRALWLYNHRSSMDGARYSELLRRDANLRAELDQLKAQNVVQDPGYVPPQLQDNPDLMFDKNFVEASYNPVVEPVVATPKKSDGIGLFGVFAILVVFGLVVYILFFKEFKRF